MHRILIADDHAAVRTALRSLFDRNGFEVCGEAVNGLDAIEKARESHPDLIVLDFCMPVMDGFEASCQLTKLGKRLVNVGSLDSVFLAFLATDFA